MMNSRAEKHSLATWVIVCLCLVAAGMSLWLTVEKLAGRIDSLVGCGKGSGCANVLGGKWSVVLGVIPVSVFSGLLYLAVMTSLFLRAGAARWFRIFAAFLMLGAAAWFTVLQLFVIGTICPYCMAMHALGVALGVVILLSERKKSVGPSAFLSGCAAAAVSVSGLAALQYLGPEPDTYRVDTDVGLSPGGGGAASNPHTRGEGRLVSFFDGNKSYRVNTLPHLGPADATHVIVKYFDYTCPSCSDAHAALEKIQKKYPGELAVIVLPVPLNRRCNPHLPPGLKDVENACALARIALRVWFADPGKFPEFHHWLFQYHTQPAEIAEGMAHSLVGTEKMDAVRDKDVEALLAQDVSDYRELVRKTPVMPKLLLKDSLILQGVTRDTATLEELLKKHLGLGQK